MSAVAQRAKKQGECVFNSLLAGVDGLVEPTPMTHGALLQHLRRDFGKVSRASDVRWSEGSCEPKCLPSRECEEMESALAEIQLGNGYPCAACDPLIIAVAAVFQVNVEHDMAGPRGTGGVFHFHVDRPRRVVHLVSKRGHMKFVRFVPRPAPLTAAAQSAVAAEPASIAAPAEPTTSAAKAEMEEEDEKEQRQEDEGAIVNKGGKRARAMETTETGARAAKTAR